MINPTPHQFLVPITILSVLIAMWIAPTAIAQNIGSADQPVYVSSELFEGTEQQLIWTKNVRIVQGKAILIADKIVGDLDQNGDLVQIVATGNVRYSDGEQAISGKKGIYVEQSRNLTMTSDVIVTQGKNVFTAGQAVYFVDTGKVKFTPEPGKRVRGVFYTNSKVKLN